MLYAATVIDDIIIDVSDSLVTCLKLDKSIFLGNDATQLISMRTTAPGPSIKYYHNNINLYRTMPVITGIGTIQRILLKAKKNSKSETIFTFKPLRPGEICCPICGEDISNSNEHFVGQGYWYEPVPKDVIVLNESPFNYYFQRSR